MEGVLDKIEPLDCTGPMPEGQAPVLDWIEIKNLRINPAYQRSAKSPRSVASIRNMVEGWDWSCVKALSVQRAGGFTYEITDGQHTAIAARTLGIEKLPCLVHESAGTAAGAVAFLGINRDRVAVSALSLFWASVTAQDEGALDVLTGAERAGARILRSARSPDEYKAGETIAVKRLLSFAATGGPVYVERVLSVGVAAGLAPVDNLWLRAFELLFWGGADFEPRLPDKAIIDAILAYGDLDLVEMAKAKAAQSKSPAYRALAEAVFRLASKREAA